MKPSTHFVVLVLFALLLFPGCATRPGSPLAAGEKPLLLNASHAGEGPVWHPVQKALYYVGGDRISVYQPGQGSRDFRNPAGGANGLLLDAQGRLIACEAGQRRVTRTELDGSITVLADSFQGLKFNSPNDVSLDAAGRIYFTDPRYGPREGMEMRDAEGRLIEGVYRIDAPGRVVRVLGREVDRPNGVLVSADGRHLFVADNNNAAGGTRKLWRFNLAADGSVQPGSRQMIFDWQTSRGPDGLKMDEAGRLYVAAGLNRPNPPHETVEPRPAGIYILSGDGALLDFVPIPRDEVTNCAFGDADRRTLYITAGGTLWSLRVNTPGRVTFTGSR